MLGQITCYNCFMNKQIIALIVGAAIITLGVWEVFLKKDDTDLIQPSSPNTSSSEKTSPEPSPRTVEQPVQLLGATEEDIRFALEESQKATAVFMPKAMPELSPAEQARIDEYAKQIMATQAALNKSKYFDIPPQEAGRSLKISSAEMPHKGFLTVWRGVRVGFLGTSELLKKGTHRNLTIPLNDYIDGAELTILVYADDGDGVLDTNKDNSYFSGDYQATLAHARYQTSRDLNTGYYAPTVWPGSASIIVQGEQLPGNKMAPPIQVNLAKSITDIQREQKAPEHFLVIHKDAGGLPGRVIGVSAPFPTMMQTFNGQGTFDLTERVYDEMLFYVAYTDNGDGRFSLVDDKPMRGVNDAIVLVRFRVAAPFE
jgi:hypothetical protein